MKKLLGILGMLVICLTIAGAPQVAQARNGSDSKVITFPVVVEQGSIVIECNSFNVVTEDGMVIEVVLLLEATEPFPTSAPAEPARWVTSVTMSDAWNADANPNAMIATTTGQNIVTMNPTNQWTESSIMRNSDTIWKDDAHRALMVSNRTSTLITEKSGQRMTNTDEATGYDLSRMHVPTTRYHLII